MNLCHLTQLMLYPQNGDRVVTIDSPYVYLLVLLPLYCVSTVILPQTHVWDQMPVLV